MDDDRDWICHEQDQSQSTSPSNLNFEFVDDPTVFYWESYNSSVWTEFGVHDHLMGSGLTSRSHGQGLQTIMISCLYFLSRAVLTSWA